MTVGERGCLGHRLSHTLIRLLAAMNLTAGLIDMLSPRYAHALANGRLSDLLVRWLLISSVALPMYAGVEAFWMWEFEGEGRPLLIDAALALTWFLFLWSRILYAFARNVLF